MHESVAKRQRRGPCARDSMENCCNDDTWRKNLVERIIAKMGERAMLSEKQIDELIFSYSTIDHHLDKGDVLVVVGKIKNLKYFQKHYSSPRVV